ncbi:xanthine dehydrogenase family protein molybdopterin-binding subunit [Acuticoccus sp. I52.16.1]|uniref:xanthine dehydrogenase family protein molybdopterin-binding subunit n=1 Tax=Acuticoccus sp. I52.16.1 TaxID=2928472 RepID=UPI001FD466AD|nr:xanthine dehydrogenase family protein molybdopterin-binding subunit [Acuticoccus sp. I52.16.1]UOM33286.1 xanthine dehydrogenase family protein molybdopterin-binding subunit [Acuticoccus sp. I52.16.1]
MADRTGRIEDVRFITGRGRYTADIAEPAALHVVFVRAPLASARIAAVDVAAAAAMPGVSAVLTAADLAADGVKPVQAPLNVTGPDGTVWGAVERPLLVGDRVRFVGEPVAMVVAASRMAAMDAAEAVDVTYADEAAVTTIPDARADGAPLVFETRPGNVGFVWAHGDRAAADAAIAAAAHRVTLTTHVTRVAPMAMEPRNAMARPEGERWAMYVSHQAPQAFRGTLAGAFGLAPEDIRVVAADVGGSFGMKMGPMREEMLVLYAARKLGVAARWVADRTEDFLTDEAGRDILMHITLGLDADGVFTGLAVDMEANLGAYATGRSQPPLFNIGGIAGVYRTPVIAATVTGVLTHTAPVSAYRGAGRPEATLAIERAVDKAARELGIDPVELRRRNLIQPGEMPWVSPFIFNYDCGDFPTVLAEGADFADLAGFPERRRQSEARGKLRGLGVAMCIEAAGGPYGRTSPDYSDVIVGEDGRIVLTGGAFSAGQGLETAMIDLAAGALGLSPGDFRYVQGDTDDVPKGKGMGGSSAMISCGSAALEAARDLIEKATKKAADRLEVAEVDVEYEAGSFRVVGTDRTVSLAQLGADAAAAGERLAGNGAFQPQEATFPNGFHVCEVEVDPDTGETRIVGYSAVEDIGRVLNPQLASGQIHGGVVQGLGQILQEDVVYSPGDGQLLSASLMDYSVPRADDMPTVRTAFCAVETALNPLKVKGVGEAGSVGAVAAGLNAVNDALAQRGVPSFDMPATPSRVWEALHKAQGVR